LMRQGNDLGGIAGQISQRRIHLSQRDLDLHAGDFTGEIPCLACPAEAI
jgi:hypothetical protein